MSKINAHILGLISSYTTGEITKEQFTELQEWLNENSEHKQTFSNYLLLYKKTRRIHFVEKSDKDKAWNEIIQKLEKPFRYEDEAVISKVKRLKPLSGILKYAAVIILFIAMGYVFQQGFFTDNTEVISPTENITLQLDNGNIEIINEDGASQIIDAQGNVVGIRNGAQLVYNSDISLETLVYNTLTVPYGKRSKVQLSDGTVVNLNAGTSLRFPVKFIEGKDREVFIEGGEAYFDVTKDLKHPFIVNTEDIGIRVLGTQFNVSSYPEDQDISTVLIEGSVGIYDKNESYSLDNATLLEPGFKADWSKSNSNIDIKKADIEMHTAWINGKIILKHMPFDNIVKKLERHYNVEIINHDKALGKDLITASFDIETIEQVFEVINEIHPIDYTVDDRKIIIN